jgi:hypothetical protein
VSPRQPSSIYSVKYICICALFANVQGSGTVAVLKNVTREKLAVFNNSSRFRSSIAVARIVRAGPVCAGTSAIAGEAALVTADADMVGGGWTEAADRAGAITVADAADANRERVTGGRARKLQRESTMELEQQGESAG